MPENFERLSAIPPQDDNPEQAQEPAPNQLPEYLQRKVDFLKTVEEEGIDFHTEEGLEQMGNDIVRRVNRLFQERYGLEVIEMALPGIIINEESARPFLQVGVDKETHQVQGNIVMRNTNDVLSGRVLGEELAHFYRLFYTPKQPKEEITNEFFGFLGQRLWQKAATEGVGDLGFLIDGEDPTFSSKREVLNVSKTIQKDLSHELDEAARQNLLAERRDMIVHQRGYEYASKMDLNQIHNWLKLFCLPNEEIRRRFFTDKPDYSEL